MNISAMTGHQKLRFHRCAITAMFSTPTKGFFKTRDFCKVQKVSNIVTIFLYLEWVFLMYGDLVNLYIHNMLILKKLISTEKFKPI